MTTRHVVLGLMRHMRARTHQECEIKLGLPGGCFSRMYRRSRYGLTMMLLDRVQVRSGLSFEQLMTWYREPELIKN
jgi:hypothetical protein